MADKQGTRDTLELSARRLAVASTLTGVVSVLSLAGLAAAGAILLAATRRLVNQMDTSGKELAGEKRERARAATRAGSAALEAGGGAVHHARSGPGPRMLEAGLRASRRLGLVHWAELAAHAGQQAAQALEDAWTASAAQPPIERQPSTTPSPDPVPPQAPSEATTIRVGGDAGRQR